VHELIPWELDEYSYRSSSTGLDEEQIAQQVAHAKQIVAGRERYAGCSALLEEETENIRHLLAARTQRADLQEEYRGLDWMLGVVDLRRLLAFQRRLVFNAAPASGPMPQQSDWHQLISLTLSEQQKDTRYHLALNKSVIGKLDFALHSSNPDLQLRLSLNEGLGNDSPLFLHGGSPFFEVAEFRGRWFLRDGYHRAYLLLRAGVHQLPAVVIRARSLEELGATEPWFFSEKVLFSEYPPMVTDFLDEKLVLHYERAALRRVIRVRIEESLQAFDETNEV
jgi:hypothetical protein